MTTETLTVVRDSSGTHPFVSTISGNVYITVKAPDNTYHYYCPTTDDLLTAELSGGTWQTVYKLDYLQSDGASYVNTLWKTSSKDTPFEIFADLAFVAGVTQTNCSFIDSSYNFPYGQYYGINTGTGDQIGFINRTNAGGTLYDKYISVTIADRHTYEIDYDGSGNNKFIFDGTEYSGTTNLTDDITYIGYAYLFALNYENTSASNYTTAKLYSMYIAHSGVKVRDYIPIKYGSTYALYDQCLSNTVIYVNQGIGTFGGGGTQSELTYQHAVTTPEIKIWNGTSWVDGTPYVWDGTEWKPATKVYVFNGTDWVEKV